MLKITTLKFKSAGSPSRTLNIATRLRLGTAIDDHYSEVMTGVTPEAGPVDCYTFVNNLISVTSQLLCALSLFISLISCITGGWIIHCGSARDSLLPRRLHS